MRVTDEDLPVSRARAGEPGAWDALFRRFQMPLYVFAVELVRNEQAALDAVQEAFISAVRHLPKLREDRKFGSWLFSIAHQKCMQHLRRARPMEALDQELLEAHASEDANPMEWLVRAEDEARFAAVLALLPEPHRAVLLLHFLEGFKIEEIAEITGVPAGTVKSRIHYAKKTLIEKLEVKHENTP